MENAISYRTKLLFLLSLLLIAITANALIPPQTIVCKPNESHEIICNFDHNIKTYFYMNSGMPSAGVYNFYEGFYLPDTYLRYNWQSSDGRTIVMISIYDATGVEPDYNNSAWPRNYIAPSCHGPASGCPYQIKNN